MGQNSERRLTLQRQWSGLHIIEDRKWVVVRVHDSIYFSEINYRALGTVLPTNMEERGAAGRVRLLSNSFLNQLLNLLLNHLPLDVWQSTDYSL